MNRSHDRFNVGAPRVAVLVDTATGWGRRMIRGISEYAATHGPWHLWIESRSVDDPLRMPVGWDGDGIIARVSTPLIAQHLIDTGKPVVNISGVPIGEIDLPRVTTDYRGSARLAVEHFTDRGLRRFAYVGPLNRSFVQEHADAFTRELESRGHAVRVHDFRPNAGSSQTWRERRDALGAFLQSLEPPIGVFSWATLSGLHVIDECRCRGISVPEDIAVLGGDEDELLACTATPPLSGLLVASEQIGLTAAAMLEKLMQRQPLDARQVLIPPIGVVTRRSTEVLAIEDDDMAQALTFVRENAFSPITVTDILREVPISRRALERKFRALLGRSPLEEIQRLRLERARQLLAQTDLPISKIAQQCGFGTPEYLATLFRREQGVGPLRYRFQLRGRAKLQQE